MDKDTDGNQADSAPLAYTLGEAAVRRHCSVNAVRRLVKAGFLRGFNLTGRPGVVTRVTAASIREFVENAGARKDGGR